MHYNEIVDIAIQSTNPQKAKNAFKFLKMI